MMINKNDCINRRLQEFDNLRIIATFAVIAIHVSAAYVLTSPPAFVINQGVRFAVPLFLIISGFLLYYTELIHPGDITMGQYFQKRFTRILWPYISWTAIYYFTGMYLYHNYYSIKASLIELANHLLHGSASYHLYFMLIIVQLYLLYPFVKWVLARRPLLTLGASFAITLSCQLFTYLHGIGILKLPLASSSLYLTSFPIWIFYFILGMFTALYRERIVQWLLKHRSVLLSLWLCFLAVLIIDGRLTGTFGSSMKPAVILYTIASYFFFYSMALKYSHRSSSWLSWLSEQSFLIYLLHPLCLIIINLFTKAQGLENIWEGFSGMLLLYIATVLLTLGFTFLIAISPFSVYLGAKTKGKTNQH